MSEIVFKHRATYEGGAVFVGDTHVLSRNLGEGVDVARDLFTHTINEAGRIAGATGASCIIHLGDLFDLHKPDKQAEVVVSDGFKRFRLPVHGISGNHDYPAGGAGREWAGARGDSPNTIVEMASEGRYTLDDMTFIDLHGGRMRVYLIPFFRHEEDFLKAVDVIPPKSDPERLDIIACHQDHLGTSPASIIDPDAPCFHGLRVFRVVNGHIHQPGSKGSEGRWIDCGLSMAFGTTWRDIPCRVLSTHGAGLKTHRIDTNWYLPPLFPDFHRPVLPAPAEAAPPALADTLDAINDTTTASRKEAVERLTGLEALPADLIPEVGDEAPPVSLDLLDVTVEGFRSWALPTTYTIDTGGLSILKAASGAGKSTLFEAVIWCLTGKLGRDGAVQSECVTLPHLRGPEWRGTRVSLRLSIDGEAAILYRHIAFKGETEGVKGGDALMLVPQDGRPVHEWLGGDNTAASVEGKANLTAAILSRLGVSADELSRVLLFDPPRCQVAQGSQSQVRAALEPLMGTAWIDTLRENAKQRIEAAKPVLMQAEADKRAHDTQSGKALAVLQEQATQRANDHKQAVYLHEMALAGWNAKKAGQALAVTLREAEVAEAAKAYEWAVTDAEACLASLPQPGIDPGEEHARMAEKLQRKWAANREEQVAIDKSYSANDAYLRSLETASKEAKRDADRLAVELDREERVLEDATLAARTCTPDTCNTCGQPLHTEEAMRLHVLDLQAKEAKVRRHEDAVAALRRSSEEADKLAAEREAAWGEAHRNSEEEKSHLRERNTELMQAASTLSASIKEHTTKAAESRREAAQAQAAYNTAIQRVADAKERHTAALSALHAARQGAGPEPDGAHLEALANQANEAHAAYAKAVEASSLEAQALQAKVDEAQADIAKWQAVAAKCAANGPLRAGVVASRVNMLNAAAFRHGAAVGRTVRIGIDPANASYTIELLVAGRPMPSSLASIGQLLIANIVFTMAMLDGWRKRLKTNAVFLDEPFSNTDPATTAMLSPLLRKPGMSVHCITHSESVDVEGARIVLIEGGVDSPSVLV